MSDTYEYHKESHPSVVDAFFKQQDDLNRFTEGLPIEVIFNEKMLFLIEQDEPSDTYGQL